MRKGFKGRTDEKKQGCGTPNRRSGRVLVEVQKTRTAEAKEEKERRLERIEEVRRREDVARFSENES